MEARQRPGGGHGEACHQKKGRDEVCLNLKRILPTTTTGARYSNAGCEVLPLRYEPATCGRGREV